jgi:hypothetical protein
MPGRLAAARASREDSERAAGPLATKRTGSTAGGTIMELEDAAADDMSATLVRILRRPSTSAGMTRRRSGLASGEAGEAAPPPGAGPTSREALSRTAASQLTGGMLGSPRADAAGGPLASLAGSPRTAPTASPSARAGPSPAGERGPDALGGSPQPGSQSHALELYALLTPASPADSVTGTPRPRVVAGWGQTVGQQEATGTGRLAVSRSPSAESGRADELTEDEAAGPGTGVQAGFGRSGVSRLGRGTEVVCTPVSASNDAEPGPKGKAAAEGAAQPWAAAAPSASRAGEARAGPRALSPSAWPTLRSRGGPRPGSDTRRAAPLSPLMGLGSERTAGTPSLASSSTARHSAWGGGNMPAPLALGPLAGSPPTPPRAAPSPRGDGSAPDDGAGPAPRPVSAQVAAGEGVGPAAGPSGRAAIRLVHQPGHGHPRCLPNRHASLPVVTSADAAMAGSEPPSEPRALLLGGEGSELGGLASMDSEGPAGRLVGGDSAASSRMSEPFGPPVGRLRIGPGGGVGAGPPLASFEEGRESGARDSPRTPAGEGPGGEAAGGGAWGGGGSSGLHLLPAHLHPAVGHSGAHAGGGGGISAALSGRLAASGAFAGMGGGGGSSSLPALHRALQRMMLQVRKNRAVVRGRARKGWLGSVGTASEGVARGPVWRRIRRM